MKKYFLSKITNNIEKKIITEANIKIKYRHRNNKN